MTVNLLMALSLGCPPLWAGPSDFGAGKDALASFFPGGGPTLQAGEAGLNRFFDRTAERPSLKAPEPPSTPRTQGDASRAEAPRLPAAFPRIPPASANHSSRLPPSARAAAQPKYQKLVDRMLSREETARYDSLILRYAERYQLGPGLLKAVIAAESEFRSQAKSRAGALGLMQLMPATAEGMGVPRRSLLDPEANIKAGASYLASLFKILYRRNGIKGSFAAAPRWIARRAIASYNGGMRFLRNRPLYRETRGYLAKVLYFWSSELSRLKLQGGPALLASRY